MPQIYKRSLAQQDLVNIWLYTYKEWGEAQAAKYAALIEKCLLQILANPKLGKLRADVKPGYRALQAGKHLIFYCVQDDYTPYRHKLSILNVQSQ